MTLRPPIPARPARPAGPAWNLLKTLAQTVVFWSLFLAVFPLLIAGAERSLGWSLAELGTVPPWASLALFGVMGGLGLWSGGVMAVRGRGTPLPFDCPSRLVVAGPYRYVRNPMAIAGLGQAAAVALMLGSWGVLAYVAAGAVVWNFLVRRWEEHDLRERFGADYEDYRGAVRCWRPRISPYARTRLTAPARS